MRTRVLFALTLLAALVGVSLIGPAHAVAPASVTSRATLSGVYHVPPITCESVTACLLDYNGNGTLQGYWMAKRMGGNKWVRLTMVAGWDNTYAAPITCATEDSCHIDYYWPVNGGLGLYWMARQADGTTWVRLTLIPGVGA